MAKFVPLKIGATVHGSRLPSGVWGVVLLVFALAGCTSCGGGSSSGSSVPELGSGEDQPMTVSSVQYCWAPSASPEPATVEILVDASGSMAGYSERIPELMEWMRRGISQIRGTSITMPSSNYSVRYFSTSGDVVRTGWNTGMPSFSAQGNTSLDAAIEKAAEKDLAFLLTDGVGFTGVGGTETCPGGVDAACVAKALRRAIRPSEGSGRMHGLWVLPLVTSFDGTFYSEQRIPVSAFNAEEAIASVQQDRQGDENKGLEIRISEPVQDGNGRLAYRYTGPRAMALLVLAKDAEVGRAAVHGLWKATELSNMRSMDRFQFRNEYGVPYVSQPLEIYPGFLPSLSWTSIERIDDPNVHDGPMEVRFSRDGEPPQAALSCVPNKPAAGIYRVEGERDRRGQESCIDLNVLPAFTFEIKPTEASPALPAAITSFEMVESSYQSLKMRFACGDPQLPSCQNGPISAQWTAATRYDGAAACLDGETCSEPAFAAIRDIATTDPSLNPHRLFGIRQVFEVFYREIQDERSEVSLAQLDVCSLE